MWTKWLPFSCLAVHLYILLIIARNLGVTFGSVITVLGRFPSFDVPLTCVYVKKDKEWRKGETSWCNGQNVQVWKMFQTFRCIHLWAIKKTLRAYLTQSGWSGSDIRCWCGCWTFPCHIGIFHCHSGSNRKWSLRTRCVLFLLSWKTCLVWPAWHRTPISALSTWIFHLPCRSAWWCSPLSSDTCTRWLRSLQAVPPGSQAGWHLPTRVLTNFCGVQTSECWCWFTHYIYFLQVVFILQWSSLNMTEMQSIQYMHLRSSLDNCIFKGERKRHRARCWLVLGNVGMVEVAENGTF